MKDFERITRLEAEVLSLINHHKTMAHNMQELVQIQNKVIEQVDRLIEMVERMEKKVNFMWLVFKTG